MTNVSIKTTETSRGLQVSVCGSYGVGSAGNATAAAILEALRGAVATAGARTVTLDMSAMAYEWGDAVGGVFRQHAEDNVDYLLNQDCAQAWNGLLSLVDPMWVDQFGERVRFVPRQAGA